MVPGQEANSDKISREVFLIFYRIIVCGVYSLELPQ